MGFSDGIVVAIIVFCVFAILVEIAMWIATGALFNLINFSLWQTRMIFGVGVVGFIIGFFR